MGRKIKPIIFWEGLPVCGLLLKKVAEKYGDDLIVVATKPRIDFGDLESELNHKIVWLDHPDDVWERRVEWNDRNFLIYTGWTHRGWLKYGEYIREKNNAKVVVAVDNSYRGDMRQFIGFFYFRFFLSKKFDAVFVPGKSATKLMRFFGVPKEKIFVGNYGAYEGIYKETLPIEKRANELLFVGELSERKGLDILIDAMISYRRDGGKWRLRIIGDGDMKSRCVGDGIIFEGPLIPREIVKRMNNAKILILPSRHDNWGTVVAEAAACGMHIIVSKRVGAGEDIVQDGKNGRILSELTQEEIVSVLKKYERLFVGDLQNGSTLSKKIASNYTSENYCNSFEEMIKKLV